MDKERLDYLLDYANRLQSLQSIPDVYLLQEINEVLFEIRYELGLASKDPKEPLTSYTNDELISELVKRVNVFDYQVKPNYKAYLSIDNGKEGCNKHINGEAIVVVYQK